MHIIKSKTLRMRLFYSYSLLFILMWSVFAAFIYLYFYSQIKQQVIARQKQACFTVEKALLNKINISDSLAMNILYSNLVRNSFEKQIDLHNPESADYLNDGSLLYLNASECSDILSNIVGMSNDIAQVNLYDLSGNMIGYGLYNGMITGDFCESGWLAATRTLNGHKYISAPHQMNWIHAGNVRPDEQYVSLTRAYKNRSYELIGYVEVMQSCHDFFDYVDEILVSEPDISIYIFNSDNDCIYPYTPEGGAEGAAYETFLPSQNLTSQPHTFKTDIQKEAILLTTYSVPSENVTILLSQPESIIYDTLGGFNKFFSVLAAAFLALILLLSFVLSDKVTKPLLDLRSAIQKVDLPSLSIKGTAVSIEDKNNLEEISDVIKAFNTMYETLSRTVNELLFAKSEEINSKILAVQAQMNPHFLYNNLTNISIMAEENMNPQIIKTCQDITFMLRYIAVQNSSGVLLSQETDYTKRYLNCMKIRYEDDLDVRTSIPPSMLDIVVPKLILQPLVENSIKYGLPDSPPWTISIYGENTDSHWKITVCDNGKGFSRDTLNNLHNEMKKFDKTAQIPPLTLSGMGLLNIYIRIKLLYKEKAVFEIKNLPSGGASVTLGCSRRQTPDAETLNTKDGA